MAGMCQIIWTPQTSAQFSKFLCFFFSFVCPGNVVGRKQEHLAGATIHPSEEDSRTFTIVCASGDTLKIRAANAQARQVWVDGLRSIVETHNTQISAVKHNFHRKRFSKKHFQSISSHADILPSRENADAYTNARQQIHNTELWSVENELAPVVHFFLFKPKI